MYYTYNTMYLFNQPEDNDIEVVALWEEPEPTFNVTFDSCSNPIRTTSKIDKTTKETIKATAKTGARSIINCKMHCKTRFMILVSLTYPS